MPMDLNHNIGLSPGSPACQLTLRILDLPASIIMCQFFKIKFSLLNIYAYILEFCFSGVRTNIGDTSNIEQDSNSHGSKFCYFWVPVLHSRHSARGFIHIISSNHPTNIDFYTHFTNEDIRTQAVKWGTQSLPSKWENCRINLSGDSFFFFKWLQWRKWIAAGTKSQVGTPIPKFHCVDGQSKFIKFSPFSLCI